MAIGNLPACLAVTLKHEGGWSDHPKDPGGATMNGVTLAVFRKYHPGATKDDLRAISDEDVQRIYRVGYWNPVRGDSLPAGVDLATFDFAVNSGVSRGAKALQAAVGAAVDGMVGPMTVALAGRVDPVKTVQAICGKRLSFVRGLSTFSTFGKGWSRRIADIEARGVKMAVGKLPVSLAMRAVEFEADAAKRRASAQDKVAAGGAAAGGWGGLIETAGADVNWWIVACVVIAALAVAAFVKSRANVNRERAAAYDRVLKEG